MHTYYIEFLGLGRNFRGSAHFSWDADNAHHVVDAHDGDHARDDDGRGRRQQRQRPQQHGTRVPMMRNRARARAMMENGGDDDCDERGMGCRRCGCGPLGDARVHDRTLACAMMAAIMSDDGRDHAR